MGCLGVCVPIVCAAFVCLPAALWWSGAFYLCGAVRVRRRREAWGKRMKRELLKTLHETRANERNHGTK